jgi:dTDP-4-dehydrorhamnose reductase
MRPHASASRDRLELWGGVECTVNRVGHRYHDQLELSGHATRPSDIGRIADLGISTVRYPLLWERIAPGSIRQASWRWPDERMELMSSRGITPIVGLVHHGSGPRHTGLLDPDFSRKLGEYADAVASRYPGIRYVTPVNEPLTTARFSALYGHWYPHQRSRAAFVTALLNQCTGIRAAFRAMKARIPGIKLVQTEDLGRVYSTSRLRYQARFENERKWLTFDLLCGRVDDDHPMWRYLAVDRRSRLLLQSLTDDPCPPDIAGINYYVTSDRFLDDRLPLHDPSAIGGNGKDRYADLEAVRILEEGISGHQEILADAWKRYGIPLAITEAHLGCTREQQALWLLEAWRGAQQARSAGCDVRAVTAWALFGSFGWDSLVTRQPFNYECGAFDVRASEPRETAIASVIRELAATGETTHPAAGAQPWWRRDDRLKLPPVSSARVGCGVRLTGPRRSTLSIRSSRPVLIVGAGGTLGSAFVRLCEVRGISARAMKRSQLDAASPRSVRNAIEKLRPWAVINAAGYVRVDDAEIETAACHDGNAVAAAVLAGESARADVPLLTFSSDLVFDGAKKAAYVESDTTSPLNAYGASKAAAELRSLELNDKTLVIRTSAFFGPWDEYNFVTIALRTLADGIPFVAAYDNIVSPTYVPDLVDAALDLLLDGERGIWHLANRGAVSWCDLARNAAIRAGLSPDLVKGVSCAELGLRARRPMYSALASERGTIMRPLDDALDRWFDETRLTEIDAVTALQA